MNSFIKDIEKRFELFESVDLKQAANDPKAFVVDMYGKGKSKAEIVDALLDAGHHRDHAEGLATRWQDSDGDGNWYEDEDVKDIKEGYYSSSPLETVIGSLGYSQGFDEFFDDNPGAVDSVMEWIISINDFRNRLKQEFDIEELEKMGIYDLDEASTSAGAGSYMTPKAFGKADDDTIEALGYRRVQEAMDKKYAQLIEGYRSYVTDNPKMTSEAKVKRTITDVSKKLKEIEELVRNASRLKTESGMSKDGYGPRVEKALNKISERLIKISERVRSLGE